jgi:membrane protein
MNRAERAAHALDRMQQRHAWFAFPVAVWKKFGDDQAGNLAALLAYYAFASLFPLLLVFITLLDIVLRNSPSLHATVLNYTFEQFPSQVGKTLESSVNSLNQTGAALVAGLLLSFLGARGVANAAQNALNTVWAVPRTQRPGFPWSLLRSFGMIVAVGLGLVVTSVLSTVAAGAGQALGGATAHVAAIAVSLLLNVGLFWLGFRLATARVIATRDLFLCAVLAALVWQVLQVLGGYFISHEIAHAHHLVYGAFALVLGLLAWLYLQAQATLFAVEIAVVRTRRLWPRSLVPPPLTPEDRRAYELYVTAEQRRPEETIAVRMGPAGDAQVDSASRAGPGA